MNQISINNVDYIYSDGFEALHDINMSIKKGERVAILGPNGAGKSTLFNMLNGIISPTSGEVKINGLDTKVKKNLNVIRRDVGMVFQDSDDQLFNSSVMQEIAYGLVNMKVSEEELQSRVKWALNVVNMDGFEKKSPHNLSGGQKKRIALASVLAMKPEVLVLDEPTVSLDPRGTIKLVKLLKKINEEMKITIVFSTHDMDIVPLFADKVYVLNEGKLILQGGVKEVFNNKKVLRNINLRLPRVAHLAEILKSDGCIEFDELPLTIGEIRKCIKNLKGGI
ncbi:cobalt/nickel transport system ATP-binding protein [Clostridium acetobutylicum]|uniref:Putative ABC transporter ATP-binding protein CA_C1368 n=1 Tax=Clostridium acetobutylicum (strain ATCC 824 / DSM 792 / JCM 1419 / IAM 19013 / LMG 5710 / NBRC 13948 / NRRL B-527 / VKM B-1787 / 2291 / W) TaxID=272562 RepID=Y1368_CLOAB|nr:MULTISPECIES: ATP-binding cassette domain-containing protein [Clostridium]Q97JB8.1 RecName: Full=Putative ABC transporter ATP-binding protein CA_C1368 [Clostridium acetobutylicum ATCC 824]AAK79336.1 Cobalt transport (ATPase component) [Clostridium acetobutylicum ATCC 824]ADZ20419.1 Cobalt transport (ATPase component) [Clostridium acetobutylicum EA 2018]AEI33965.1 cobalt transport (ATPase component) [Clostridium acetobutylicum DSM 1731]AWV81415.1 ATP-binding cassette domain-containing protei